MPEQPVRDELDQGASSASLPTVTGAAHTPGPWGISYRRPGGINGAWIVAGGGLRVASLPRRADKSIPQKNADANLIAAAPETREAGAALLAAVDQFVAETAEPLFVEEREALRAALLKGLGNAETPTPDRSIP
jgi:hypothetical protein